MHSYSATDLKNYYIQQEAEEAFDTGILSKESNEKIKTAYSCKLYKPNFFIRIALSLLCIVCVIFTSALFFLIAYSSSDAVISGILFFMFLTCYGLLEYFVKRKKYYNAGIDNTLQVFTTIFFAGMFVNNTYTNQDVWVCMAVLIPAIWLCIRFTDSFMALIAYLTFITLVCLLCKHAGSLYVLYAPFLIMLTCGLLFVMQRLLKNKKRFSFYRGCFSMLRILSLSVFYISCNVYVVTRLSDSIFRENIIIGKTYFVILLVLNLIIPVLYITYGFIKNKTLFLRIGFIALVATAVTIFYFYYFVSGEIWLIAGGCIMIISGYAGMRFFKHNKFGFTAISYSSLHKTLTTAEALTTVQSAYKSGAVEGIQFGGGSSGGAGASGNW